MPYVHRDAMGRIESVHRAATSDAIEYLDSEDAELKAFFGEAARSKTFAEVDADVVRVLEDVLDVLLAKGVIAVGELPQEAQAKWLLRKELRSREDARRFSASGFVEIIDDSSFGNLTRP